MTWLATSTLRETLYPAKCACASVLLGSSSGPQGASSHQPSIPARADCSLRPLCGNQHPTPRLGGVALAEAPPRRPHWLRLPGAGVCAPQSETLQLRPNAVTWEAGEDRLLEERASAPGKPRRGSWGDRLPPGEPCREGECLLRAGGLGVRMAMRPGGRSRVLVESRKGNADS